MKKVISLTLVVSIFLAGCAGREANPIPIYLPGDENRSCASLKAEVAQLQVDMARMLPKTNKGVTNALWATAGVFLIVPFFFMDFKDAEKIEFDALRKRHNRLLIYAAEKNCDMFGVRAERIPSAKEAQAKTTTAIEQPTICVNCEEKIGKLEKSYTYENHTVCAKCYEKLNKAL